MGTASLRTQVGDAIASCDLLIVGSGLYGLTIAERAASQGFRVVVLEKRAHVGGNAYSYTEPTSRVEVHKYGSHLFHTSNKKVWDYVNKFTSFNSYRHHVWTRHNNCIFPMPVNLATISSFFQIALGPDEARAFIKQQVEEAGISEAVNLEDRAISLVGRPLYEALIRGYTAKQWQTDPRDLPAAIISRLPVRFSFNNRYFEDTWEGLPLNGYESWFRAMLENPLIQLFLDTDYFEIRNSVDRNVPVVYTGPLDRYFDYAEGVLGWRTLDFKLDILETEDFQGTSVMNYADSEIPFTRIHEFKHLHPERTYTPNKTVIMYEFSRSADAKDEPYYPINTDRDRSILEKYRSRTALEQNVFFGGRLGSYQYLDMHMAIASALTAFENRILGRLKDRQG